MQPNTACDVHGIVLLDKPVGISSNAALQIVKRLYRARKAGHTGSLDPLASGLLPLCLGEATKISAYLLDSDKRYHLHCKLGATTSTGDAEGEILEVRPVTTLSAAQLDAVFTRFTGPLEQIPPMYSALKHHGQPLYKLARRGQTVERAARAITVYSINLLDYRDALLQLEVHCSKGTYMRTLAEDIGAALGCGAHLNGLRRIAVGGFDETQMLTLEHLQTLSEQGNAALERVLYPIQSALVHWPMIYLSEQAAHALRRGQIVQPPHELPGGHVQLVADNDRFLGIGEVLHDGRIAPRRLINSSR